MLAQEEAQAPTKDVVRLKNGDRVTGKVSSFADGKIVVTTDLVGEVSVPVDNIAELTTVEPITIVTSDGETFSRRVTGLKDGNLVLAGEGPAVEPLPLASLTAINPPPKEPEAWTGSINIGAYFFDGNTEQRGVNAAANASRRTDIDRLTANANWEYNENRNSTGVWELAARRVSGALQYDYFLTEKSYVLATTRAEGDTLSDLDILWTGGAGYGVQWYESDDFWFKTEAGLTFVHKSYRSATPTDEYLAARIAYGLRWKVSENVTFLQDVEYTPSLESSDELLVLKNSRIQVALTESMFSEFKWELDFDNDPSPGQDRVDNRFFITVGWSF
eukprot:jgi/Undpi1/11753/HiC_scaffold_37.g14048.m1